MNRSSGIGLMAFSIVLVVVGAIMAFAVTVDATGFSINTVGWILLIAGIVAFVVSLFLVFIGAGRRSMTHEDVRNVPGGQHRVTEHEDSYGAQA